MRGSLWSVYLGIAASAAIFAGSCRTMQSAADLTSQAAKVPQCSPGSSFKSVCQVLEVSGRQGVSTEAARASFAGEIAEVRFAVTTGERDAHAEAQFLKKTGPMADLEVKDALDLYGRKGCLAEINGGVFGEGFTPRVTLRVLFNVQDEARSAQAELSDYRTGKVMHATLGLKCDWQ